MSSQNPGTFTAVLDVENSASRTLQDKSETSTAIMNTEKTPCDGENGRPPGQSTIGDVKTPPSSEDEYLVNLDAAENPKNLSTARKWVIVIVISTGALCATFASSVAAFTEAGLAKDLHTVHEVTILSISLFVFGLGMGPLLVGPLSELYGRNIIYRISYLLCFAFTWPTAFPPNIEVFLVFRFITGFCSAAFLSVAGGSVSDLFVNAQVASPMAVYTMAPFIGPVIGPIVGGFINQNVDWRWTYRVLLMWQFVEIILLLLLVPETYEPLLLQSKARRVRKETGDDKYYAPLDRRERSILSAMLFSCYTPFKLILFDRMALALDTWNALLLGILYLSFQAFPIIFGSLHGFTYGETGLSFLGIGIGMFAALATQPLWNRFYRKQTIKYNGPPPPETRLVMGQWGAIMAPIGLFWLAFTTYKHVF
ncbi:Efflux pump atB [Sparassis crispa]|uniref:Efflux pump atB n=1 Tax=Sparassis crispa TaxID=139825 RepID=A0A401H532_9APHY|nr:Efflux pump atB [Sparassis crispa]GBE89555.1 Efflux pump atB [Sparassis crispa]